MHVFDTLIVGCGYFSAGYALARENCLICEEHQICDTGFYLPMRSFSYVPYTPKTIQGAELFDIFNSMSLFKDGEQNTNYFEIAFCKFLAKTPLSILLKCRLISHEQRNDNLIDALIQTNSGLEHVLCKRILNTTNSYKFKRYTVLFCAKNPEIQKICAAFDDAIIEPAFYEDRYALHFSLSGYDENTVKDMVARKWEKLDTNAKILYMAPVFHAPNTANTTCDDNYQNPIMAFEAGYFYAKEQNDDTVNS